ncbi:MAG: DNA-directed RNA polymerase subunit alpha [Chloroflexota bacterium]|nr:DNA-directed RNA polymerase subunit alpha [Chloroflexota bacterium]
MVSLVLPKVEYDISTQEYGRFIISPLRTGYGATIGNALRRVLLSSLPGAAVTSIRVSDMYHEYSSIPHVKEDMIELTLNVKRLRVKMETSSADGMEGESSARLHIDVQSQGIVTAADVDCPPNVEIVNPELYLFTVDSDDAEVYVEMTVERGIGYSPAEERDSNPSVGDIEVDAVFSPVRKVNYDVGQARVGQSTNFDSLTLEIWTDGTIGPQDALNEAVRILMRHFAVIGGEVVSPLELELPGEKEEKRRRLTTPVEDLELSTRVYNCLKREGISEVGEVLDKLYRFGDDGLLDIRNLGVKSLAEVKEKLIEHGFSLPSEERED